MNDSKHILFISYDGMTDPLGQSQVIPYLAGLSKYGFKFTILSCEKKDRFEENQSYVMALLKAHNIEWVPIYYHKSPQILSSIYDFYALKRKARFLCKEKKIDMVHTRPGVPTVVALWLKKKYGIKFLNDIRGFWADERVDGGMWNLTNLVFKTVYQFFKKHELECISYADYNTCLTYKAKEEILGWPQVPKQLKIEVIPCSVDLQLFNSNNIDPVERSAMKAELNIKDDDFIITYLGSIGGWYLVDEMMAFFKSLEKVKPKAKFLFISPHRHEFITSAVAKFGIPAHKVLSRKAQRHEVPVLLSFSSYSIFFIKKCYSKISSSPTKHGEIMAMGIPVITNDGVGDVSLIVNKYHGGVVLQDLSLHCYDDLALDIAKGLIFDHAEIIKGANDFYSLDRAIAKYLNVYNHVLN